MLLSKVVAPSLPRGAIARPRLLADLAKGERVTSIVAPPGYGKTVAARQLIAATGTPAAWFDVDLLDDNPTSFWLHFIGALQTVIPGLGEEPALLLAERGPRNAQFLAALMTEIEASGLSRIVVLDGLMAVTDRSVFESLALLVDRIGHQLRLVLVSRSDPPLPTARWQSAGWLGELREEQLSFTDDEALAVAKTFTDLALADDAVLALNRRTEGWPVGLQLALLSLRNVADPDLGARRVAGSDRLLADYLVTEVLEQLPPRERQVALDLSVLEWFDAELCRSLLGSDAVPIARELQRRRLFLATIDEHRGAMRFHSLFRELLETELRWRDPDRRITLHRDAAKLLADRGDLNAAYRHLVKIDDLESARNLVLQPALALVDRGDAAGLAQRMRSLPPDMEVDSPDLALDLAVAWFFAGHDREATEWCDRAERMAPSDDADATRLRVHSTRCIVALMRGELAAAVDHVSAVEAMAGRVPMGSYVEARFATVAARVMLASRRLDEARTWVAGAAEITEPAPVARVIVPALVAWLEMELGDLARATAIAEGACAHVEEVGQRPHHGAFEALVVAAWCRVGAGDLVAAEELAEQARIDGDMLGFPWNRIRAGVLAGEICRLTEGPRAALEAVRALKEQAPEREPGHLVDELHLLEARSLAGCDADDDARSVLDLVADGPRRSLLLARIATKQGSFGPAGELLADRARWSVAERLEAEVLLAVDPSGAKAEERMAAVLAQGAATGWVSPFLGQDAAVARLLDGLPVERLHPLLAAARRPRPDPARANTELLEPLTARELTIIELLPTHLSYAQIGERLYLSINTVKGNLKTIYRKLGVSSRAGAVEVAAEAGLV